MANFYPPPQQQQQRGPQANPPPAPQAGWTPFGNTYAQPYPPQHQQQQVPQQQQQPQQQPQHYGPYGGMPPAPSAYPPQPHPMYAPWGMPPMMPMGYPSSGAWAGHPMSGHPMHHPLGPPPSAMGGHSQLPLPATPPQFANHNAPSSLSGMPPPSMPTGPPSVHQGASQSNITPPSSAPSHPSHGGGVPHGGVPHQHQQQQSAAGAISSINTMMRDTMMRAIQAESSARRDEAATKDASYDPSSLLKPALHAALQRERVALAAAAAAAREREALQGMTVSSGGGPFHPTPNKDVSPRIPTTPSSTPGTPIPTQASVVHERSVPSAAIVHVLMDEDSKERTPVAMASIVTKKRKIESDAPHADDLPALVHAASAAQHSVPARSPNTGASSAGGGFATWNLTSPRSQTSSSSKRKKSAGSNVPAATANAIARAAAAGSTTDEDGDDDPDDSSFEDGDSLSDSPAPEKTRSSGGVVTYPPTSGHNGGGVLAAIQSRYSDSNSGSGGASAWPSAFGPSGNLLPTNAAPGSALAEYQAHMGAFASGHTPGAPIPVTIRNARRIGADRRRRAKLKEALNSLREIIVRHGQDATNFDQVSVLWSSVDLMHTFETMIEHQHSLLQTHERTFVTLNRRIQLYEQNAASSAAGGGSVITKETQSMANSGTTLTTASIVTSPVAAKKKPKFAHTLVRGLGPAPVQTKQQHAPQLSGLLEHALAEDRATALLQGLASTARGNGAGSDSSAGEEEEEAEAASTTSDDAGLKKPQRVSEADAEGVSSPTVLVA